MTFSVRKPSAEIRFGWMTWDRSFNCSSFHVPCRSIGDRTTWASAPLGKFQRWTNRQSATVNEEVRGNRKTMPDFSFETFETVSMESRSFRWIKRFDRPECWSIPMPQDQTAGLQLNHLVVFQREPAKLPRLVFRSLAFHASWHPSKNVDDAKWTGTPNIVSDRI